MEKENPGSEMMSKDQLDDLFGGTQGKPTSPLDTLTVYRAGKEDYFRRGDDKVQAVIGILLYSQRPTRVFWESDELSNKPPDCWSLDSIRPHPEASNIQADECGACPNDKFGTAHLGGGKACKTRASDFLLEVTGLPLPLPAITAASIPVVTLDPKMIVGAALVQYSIGTRNSAMNYQGFLRFLKERGSHMQAIIVRYGFDKARSRSNVEFDVVQIEPVARIRDEDLQTVAPYVRDLKGGLAVRILEMLSGPKPEAAAS